MEELGITKYEAPVKQIQLASGRKIKWRDNQNFHIYYKFPNLKNVAGLFTEEDGVQITRKLHGTNARYGIVKKSKLGFWDRVKKFLRLADEWIGYEYIYGSHNCEKGSDSQGFYSTDVWRTSADFYKIKEKLWRAVKTRTVEEIGSGFVLYGEIYGAGIQKNYEYGLKDGEHRIAIFDIKKLADDDVKFKLAVSLHSAIDEIRSRIMPFSENFPLADLREALEYWYRKTKSKVSYEYVVWKGINDNKASVDALVKFCKYVPCKVNLIEYNPIDDGEFQQASEESINAYIKALEASGIVVKVRRSRGKDIDAACGQLANKEA